MPVLFYLHWNEQELLERITHLNDLDFEIHSHSSQRETPQWKERWPDIFVISLEHLPSHGREYAQWLRSAKKRNHIPLIFVDGQSDKVEQMKLIFPDAIFCSREELPEFLKKISGKL
ncbi:MAG: hypothetical protein Fur0041_11900 [Bacteroidia bacterium]